MTSITLQNNDQQKSMGILLISALSITLFLAFIDEGQYNFNWMAELGGWIAIAIYTAIIFGVQYLVFKALGYFFKRANRLFLSVLVGGGLGFFVTVGITMALSY